MKVTAGSPATNEEGICMNIIVLAGGTSTERAVSIVSGTQVTKALRSIGHCAVLLDVFAGDGRIEEGLSDEELKERVFTEEYDLNSQVEYISSFNDMIEEMIAVRKRDRIPFFGPNVLRLCRIADVVFLALHGSNGEDGRIQAAFDLLNIPYTGSGYLGSALAMDKAIAKQMFWHNGVPTPKGIAAKAGDEILSPQCNGVGLPCVVKPSCGGSSVGVSIARTQEEYEAALAEGFRYEDVLIVEQYINGREFSVGVVDGKAYPVIEIAPLQGFYDYHNKYQAGSTVETCPADLPADLTVRMQQHAMDAYHALKLTGYGRIDIMMNEDNEMFCLEANTLPGMTPTSLLPQEAAALGMDFAMLCQKLVDVSLKQNI